MNISKVVELINLLIASLLTSINLSRFSTELFLFDAYQFYRIQFVFKFYQQIDFYMLLVHIA